MELVCNDTKIRLRMDDSEKNSVLIVGGSRMGKTFFASNLAEMLIQQGMQVHLIDLGSKWGFRDKERIEFAGAVIRPIESQGIDLIFHSSKELIGCARVIADAIGFQSLNASTTLKNVFHRLRANIDGAILMKDVIEALIIETEEDNSHKDWAAKIYDRLEIYDEVPNVKFRVNEDEDFSNSSTIWDLTGLDDEYVHIISSLITYSLICQQKWYFKNSNETIGMFVIIDEFQNLDCNRRSVIGTCLTEGQKYGLNMILITQFLNGNFSEAVINQFKQGGFRFYFRLTEEEAAIVSKQVASEYRRRNELYKKLISLQTGNCLMLGPHSVGERNEVTEAFRFVEIKETEAESGYNRGMVFIRKK